MAGQLTGANDVVERHLDQSLESLEKRFGATVLVFAGPLFPTIDEQVREAVEQRPPENGSRKLVVVLETAGGSVTAVERIVRLFRRHYKSVEYIIPNYAMSAGTILALSGDAIHMDYFSVLGPIDPQVQKGGKLVPALGYLIQYERLIKKSQEANLTMAELSYLLKNFDPAELYTYEQEKELTKSLLIDWLVQSKLIDWQEERDKKRRVTQKKRKERAERVADNLGNTDKWHSHARGIPIEVLRKDIGLVIKDFGSDDDLNSAVRAYYTLLRDYMIRIDSGVVIHVKGVYRSWRFTK